MKKSGTSTTMKKSSQRGPNNADEDSDDAAAALQPSPPHQNTTPEEDSKRQGHPELFPDTTSTDRHRHDANLRRGKDESNAAAAALQPSPFHQNTPPAEKDSKRQGRHPELFPDTTSAGRHRHGANRQGKDDSKASLQKEKASSACDENPSFVAGNVPWELPSETRNQQRITQQDTEDAYDMEKQIMGEVNKIHTAAAAAAAAADDDDERGDGINDTEPIAVVPDVDEQLHNTQAVPPLITRSSPTSARGDTREYPGAIHVDGGGRGGGEFSPYDSLAQTSDLEENRRQAEADNVPIAAEVVNDERTVQLAHIVPGVIPAPSAAIESQQQHHEEETVQTSQAQNRKLYYIIAILLSVLAIVGIIVGVVVLSQRESDSPAPTPTSGRPAVPVTVAIRLDLNSDETSWRLDCVNQGLVRSVPSGTYKSKPNQTIESIVPEIHEGEECTFTIRDDGNNGIDDGFYRIYYDTDTSNSALLLVDGTGEFISEATARFTVLEPSVPSPTTTTDMPTTREPTHIPSFVPTNDSVISTPEPTFDPITTPAPTTLTPTTPTTLETLAPTPEPSTPVQTTPRPTTMPPTLLAPATTPPTTLLAPGTKTTWTQVGDDIDGLNAGDRSGSSVSLSSSGDILVVGANAVNTGRPGTAQVYELNSSTDTWDKVGQLLVGQENTNNEGDGFGYAVSVSDEGLVVAISAPYNNNKKGSVYIYNIINTSSSTNNKELELIQTLHGDSEGDEFGSSIALSGNGNTIAVGADQWINDDPGYVKVYQADKTGSTNTNQYNQIGNTLTGKSSDDIFGDSVALSYDGSVVTIGAPWNDDNGDLAGKAYIYQYNKSSNNWDDFGSNNNNNILLKGDNERDRFGSAVSSSSSGEIVAISAPRNDGINGDKSACGTIKILKLNQNDNKWHQLGDNIDGEDEYDNAGIHQGVSLSNSGTVIAIGSYGNNNDNGINSGSVRIYEYISDTDKWTKISQDIDGEADFDYSGESVSLNGDGNMVAIGAPGNDGNGFDGFDGGHVRVYRRGDDTNA